MSINGFNIKKWYKMLTGNSILHVNQKAGKLYKKNELRGYYNDLREKVLRSNIEKNMLPKTELSNGEKIDFPIAIFQYGLGAYDLYLETKNIEYYIRFMNAVHWAINNQESKGGWKSFESTCKRNPYSSMSQGEGISLLLRAYCQTKNKEFLKKAENALNFMMTNVKENGCTVYENNDVYLKEFPENPVVLNGWIFSLFGLYDYYIETKDKKTKNFFDQSVKTLIKTIPNFDTGYWSKYDINKRIASPFYHKLHVELLTVLHDLTNEQIFLEYAKKFALYQNKKINRIRAFIKKVFQKIIER